MRLEWVIEGARFSTGEQQCESKSTRDDVLTKTAR